MDKDDTRRGFMMRMIFVVFGFISTVLTVTLGGFGVIPALKKKSPEWSDAGTVADLVVDQPRERRFLETIKQGWQAERQERTVWLVRKGDGSVVAYSSNCPHLGCGYRWIETQGRFECPCHASIFDINGNVVAGPAPRPLDQLATKVENGRISVRYEVFQLGITKRVTV